MAAINPFQNQVDKRFGQRGVVPVQDNQAANGIQTTLGNAGSGTRSQQNTGAIGGPQIAWSPNGPPGQQSGGQQNPWAPQPANQGTWGGAQQGGGGQTDNSWTPAGGAPGNVQGQNPNANYWGQGSSAASGGAPAPMSYNEFISSGHSGSEYSTYLQTYQNNMALGNAGNVYNQFGNAATGMLGGTNIDVLGGQQPQNPGRFDQYNNAYWNQPDIYSQVGGQMGNFNPNIQVQGSGPAPNSSQITPGATNYMDWAQTQTNNLNVGTPGGIDPVTGLPREQANAQINAGPQFNQAIAGQMATAQQLQNAAGGAGIDVAGLMQPFEASAQRQAAIDMERGQGMLGRIGGGGNIGAQTGLASEINQNYLNTVGQAHSNLATTAAQLQPQMLSAQTGALTGAGSTYGNVANTTGQLGTSQAQLNLAGTGQQIEQRSQDIGVNLQNNANSLIQRGQDIGVLTGNADRLAQQMLGMSQLDLNKYVANGELDVAKLNADITSHFQDRGMNLQEAQFQAEQYFGALNATMGMQGQQGEQQAQMAQLAQQADQGDQNAGLQYAGLLLDQAVASGQLTVQQQSTALNTLMSLWNNPQEFALQYEQIKKNFQSQERDRNLEAWQQSNGALGLGGLGVSVGPVGVSGL